MSDIWAGFGLRGYSFPIALALAITCFALNFPIALFGPTALTSNRIGLMLLVGMALVRLNRIRVSRGVLYPAIALCVIACWGLISAIYSPYVSTGEASPIGVVRWFFACGVLLGVYSICCELESSDLERTVNWLIICAAIVNAWTWWRMMNDLGLHGLSNPWMVRGYFAEVGAGLNRYMNGLFTLAALPIGATVGVIRARVPQFVLSIAVAASTTLLALVTGSRQTILAITVLLLILLAQQRRRMLGARMPAIIISAAAIVAITQAVGARLDLWSWAKYRIVDTTQAQYTSGSERLRIWNDALRAVGENVVFGVGPGGSPVAVGGYVDNAYLAVAAELGLAPALIIVAALLYIIIVQLGKRRGIPGEIDGLRKSVLAYVVVYAFVSAVFNELLTDYALWAFVAILISLGERGRERRQRWDNVGSVVLLESAR